MNMMVRASESLHWYNRDGTPQYTVKAKDGSDRSTTLRDARKMNLVPSVTTIMKCAASPGLEAWKLNQMLMAALTLPKTVDESEESYIQRIIRDSKEQGKLAAEAGTDIHEAIQSFYEGRVSYAHQESVKSCFHTVRDHFVEQPWISERSFSHELGFGGKSDLFSPAADKFDGIVLDIKTKEFSDPKKVDGYDEHLMQLAAYRVGLGCPTARCANVFVSRTVAGLVVINEWSQEDLARGWSMFCALLQYWQAKNQHF